MFSFVKIPKDDYQLLSHRLDIWQIDLENHQLPLTLTNKELMQAKRFHKLEHQQRFIAARNSLRYLLGLYLAMPSEKLRLKYTNNGKPHLANLKGLEFNLSHSQNLALIALSNHPVGIDLEFYSKRNYQAIAQNFFSLSEQAFLHSFKSMHAFAFFNLWTQKEAFVKANGLGIFHPLSSINFCYDSLNKCFIYDEIQQNSWQLQSFMPRVACQASVCYSIGITEIRYGFLNEIARI